MSTDLLLLRESTIEQAFITGDGVDVAIKELTDIVHGYEHSLDTASGRKKTASLAAKVSKVKTKIDAIGKDIVSEWKSKAKIVDANRKKLRDACDELRDEARKPLTEWEEEQERIEAEKEAKAEAEKLDALIESDHEIGLLLNEKRDDDIAAQIILEAQAAEERKRIEREQLEREAHEKAERLLIDQREQLERDQVAAKVAIENAERAVIAAEEAKKEAEIAATNAAESAKVQAEEKQKAKELAEKVAIEKRETNKRHVGSIRKAAKESLIAIGVDEAMAKKIVLAISSGSIANITINY